MNRQTRSFFPGASSSVPAGWIEALQRIQGEYMAVPGLCLTSAQAARLLGLELHEGATVLNALVDAGVLRCTPTGYVRAVES